jgi:hypothetical protein
MECRSGRGTIEEHFAGHTQMASHRKAEADRVARETALKRADAALAGERRERESRTVERRIDNYERLGLSADKFRAELARLSDTLQEDRIEER